MNIKLNLGASPIWHKEGWHVLDHKLKETDGFKIAGDAADMDLPDACCDIVFCSHVFEHIPHTRLPLVISEINRVLKIGGIFRILTPDLKKVATAYVNSDDEFFKRAKKEDSSLRTDLGLGGSFMNFIVSPGQDTILLNRGLTEFIAGYAHLYSYDFSMLEIMLTLLGFEDCVEPGFCVSEIDEMTEPYHVDSLPPIWQEFNPEFYNKNNLQHELIDGTYHIDFKVTGFDRDPLTSLIIECKKKDFVSQKDSHEIFNLNQKNYNRYAYSLLKDPQVSDKLASLGLTNDIEE
jgi:SAM-dependent methyltransferase